MFVFRKHGSFEINTVITQQQYSRITHLSNEDPIEDGYIYLSVHFKEILKNAKICQLKKKIVLFCKVLIIGVLK